MAWHVLSACGVMACADVVSIVLPVCCCMSDCAVVCHPLYAPCCIPPLPLSPSELYHSFGSSALLSRYSRLLIDPNRDATSDTLIRTMADAQPVQLNQSITPQGMAHTHMLDIVC